MREKRLEDYQNGNRDKKEEKRTGLDEILY